MLTAGQSGLVLNAMGCFSSKAKVEPEPQMTVLQEPEEPPATDSRLPLDARQVFRLKKSWKGIKRKLTDTGVELFVGLVVNHSINVVSLLICNG